jgi:hypothetical protein
MAEQFALAVPLVHDQLYEFVDVVTAEPVPERHNTPGDGAPARVAPFAPPQLAVRAADGVEGSVVPKAGVVLKGRRMIIRLSVCAIAGAAKTKADMPIRR